MRRTRRKPRVIWLPVHGRDFANAPEVDNFGNGIGGALTVANDGALYHDVQAVTFDYSDSASAEEGSDFRSLHELAAGNAYRLRRIVGKFHAAALIENNTETEIPLVQVAAGFEVNRTDADGNLANTFLAASAMGPLAQDSAEDPWIWRRTWMLSPVQPIVQSFAAAGTVSAGLVYNTQTVLGAQGLFPHTTAHYGSVQDGPHIDQKTARLIGNQERLFFWVQARVTNPSSNTRNAIITYNLDLRILASLRTQVGNRRNASR